METGPKRTGNRQVGDIVKKNPLTVWAAQLYLRLPPRDLVSLLSPGLCKLWLRNQMSVQDRENRVLTSLNGTCIPWTFSDGKKLSFA